MDDSTKDKLKNIIGDIRYQLKCNDANIKRIHPEKNGLAMTIGHSAEMGNIHVHNKLKELESILGFLVNEDAMTVLSDRNADYSKRDSDV